ncbi:MAG: hypothetical protein HC800_06265 [Phormidesmis sp. RL_2_1]|nr:hypothetical protein [Phormidesmis sp. RL_2_1]
MKKKLKLHLGMDAIAAAQIERISVFTTSRRTGQPVGASKTTNAEAD